MKYITRNQAKSLNFASAYGMSDAKIQKMFRLILKDIKNPIPGDKRTTRVIRKILKCKRHTSTGFSKRKTKKLQRLFKAQYPTLRITLPQALEFEEIIIKNTEWENKLTIINSSPPNNIRVSHND